MEPETPLSPTPGDDAQGSEISQQTALLWVIPHRQFDLGEISEQLQARGYRVHCCLPGESRNLDAAVRVLQADLFATFRQLRLEYQADPRPTLVLAGSLEQEIAALDFVGASSDIVRAPYPVELINFRLGRMLQQPAPPARIDALQLQDALTGLPNRRRIEALLKDFILADGSHDCRAVVLFDLDRFKAVNDRYGRAKSDAVLHEFALLMQRGAAPGDRYGRFGGDEFIGLVSRYDEQTVIKDVESLLKRVGLHDFLVQDGSTGTVRVAVTASAGIAFVQLGASPEEPLADADHALHEAKRRGRNRLVVFEAAKEGGAEAGTAPAVARNRDLKIERFRSVARVLNDRMAELAARFAQNLIEDARREPNLDDLTGLANRRHFDRRLGREIERHVKYQRPLTIALMDLDHFASVNLTFGYPTGSHLLGRFAQLATGCVRADDWIARCSGDVFCLVMQDTALEAGARVAERIRRTLESTEFKSLDQRPLRLTVSVGVAQWSESLGDPLWLLQNAGAAVGRAKQAGGNRVGLG